MFHLIFFRCIFNYQQITMNISILPDNHRRSLSSSLFIVENLLNELEKELTDPTNLTAYKIVVDLNEEEKQRILTALGRAKHQLSILFHKYQLKVKAHNLSHIIRAQKTKMWEVLCDSTSKGLKGYGLLPDSVATQLDSDIEKLQELINQI